jgi:hypothetical protein
MTENAKSLAAKLLAVMEEIDSVEKGGRNQTQNYSYVKSADVARAVRKALIKAKVWPEVTMGARHDCEFANTNSRGETKTWHGVDVQCIIVFVDTETGERSQPTCALGTAFALDDKAIYKAQTGAIKYALRDAFLIPDESDPEADESVDHWTAEQKQSYVAKKLVALQAEVKPEPLRPLLDQLKASLEVTPDADIPYSAKVTPPSAPPAKDPVVDYFATTPTASAYSPKYISEPQLKRLWAIAHQAQFNREQVEGLAVKLGYSGPLAELPRVRGGVYDKLCSEMESLYK